MLFNANSLIATIHFWFIYCQASLCYKDNCYFLGSEKLMWHDAKYYCLAKGGDLTSIHSREENYYVMFVCATNIGSFDQCWIGLTDENRERQWEWVDGSAYGYENWAKVQSYNKPTSDYVRMVNGGLWSHVGPRSHHFPVCKISKTPTVRPTMPIEIPEYKCLEDNCYYTGSSLMGWHDSKYYCKSKGGNLTSIHSKAENDFLTLVCGLVSPRKSCWIGLTNEKRLKKYDMWVDGSALNYQNWRKNEPNYNGQAHVYIGQDGKWGDVVFQNKYNPICKISKVATWSPIQPTGIPTATPTGSPTRSPTTSPTAEPSNSPTARCCHIKPVWTTEVAAENCPASFSSKRFPVKACKKSFQKRLEVSMANELYDGCESKCVYDYKMMAKGKGAFLYKERKKCYVHTRKGECFKRKTYGEAMRQIANRLLKKDVC